MAKVHNLNEYMKRYLPDGRIPAQAWEELRELLSPPDDDQEFTEMLYPDKKHDGIFKKHSPVRAMPTTSEIEEWVRRVGNIMTTEPDPNIMLYPNIPQTSVPTKAKCSRRACADKPPKDRSNLQRCPDCGLLFCMKSWMKPGCLCETGRCSKCEEVARREAKK